MSPVRERVVFSPVRERPESLPYRKDQNLSRTGKNCLKYSLSRPGEICGCSNAPLRIFSVADFCTLKYSWEMRETPFEETGFQAVGPWLAAQVSQTMVPQVGFWCFRSKTACFTRFFVSFVSPAFAGFLVQNLDFHPKRAPFLSRSGEVVVK